MALTKYFCGAMLTKTFIFEPADAWEGIYTVKRQSMIEYMINRRFTLTAPCWPRYLIFFLKWNGIEEIKKLAIKNKYNFENKDDIMRLN